MAYMQVCEELGVTCALPRMKSYNSKFYQFKAIHPFPNHKSIHFSSTKVHQNNSRPSKYSSLHGSTCTYRWDTTRSLVGQLCMVSQCSPWCPRLLSLAPLQAHTVQGQGRTHIRCNLYCMHTIAYHLHPHAGMGHQQSPWAVAAVPASCMGHEKV